MKKSTIHEGLPSAIFRMSGALLAIIFAYASPVKAQIVPDATLPANSIVTSSGNSFTIEGGTTAGSNLFHSFQEFSVPTSAEAFFNNSTAIDNIITRVTGGKISNIDGLIRANGTASLFLLNPKGIIFGPNARLNIGGSFFGSTAEGLLFEDGTVYSATNPEAPPLLAINVPLGLQYGSTSAAIQVLGPPINRENPPETPAGLQVNPGQTLGLLAGEITIDGVLLKAPSGRIELGSIGETGQVSLSSTPLGWVLGYEGIENFQDITLSRGSVVDTSSDIGGGSIQVQSRSLFLRDGAKIVADSSGTGPGGLILVRGTEAIELSGRNQQSFVTEDSSFSSINAEVFGEGDGGEVTISTGRLLLDNGARIFSTTSGAGNADDVTIIASKSVELRGVFSDGQGSSIESEVESEATGNGGNIIIETGSLILNDGAVISSRTDGKADAGNISIRAASSVELTGENNLTDDPSSGILSQTTANTDSESHRAIISKVDAGDITIETGRLILWDGAIISSETDSRGDGGTVIVRASELVELRGDNSPNRPSSIRSGVTPSGMGNAGEVFVETSRLFLSGGAKISSETNGVGNGGTVIVRASELVEVRGTSSENRPSSIRSGVQPEAGEGNAGSVFVETSRLLLWDRATIASESKGPGNGGNLVISAEELIVRDNSRLNVSGPQREGNFGAGTLQIGADRILLENQGSLLAETAAGDQGNIIVQTQDLQLRGNSEISTNATEIATGGNITITTDTLAALENSDITANAVEGAGGNIIINTQGIFLDPDSEITASSQLGLNGTVTVNTPELDPSSGLVEQRESQNGDLVGKDFCEVSKDSSFVITGRGGIASSPYNVLTGEISRVNLVDPVIPGNYTTSASGQRVVTERSQTPYKRESRQIVEATGWIQHRDGTIELVATRPGATPWLKPLSCQDLSDDS